MNDTKFTSGDWSIYIGSDNMNDRTVCKLSASTSIVSSSYVSGDLEGDANLISQSPAMYKEIESLIYELSMAIDEVNTMRDIHHTDRLTPSDHWDKESCHNAQVLLSKCRGE